jgi:hypothetical protein
VGLFAGGRLQTGLRQRTFVRIIAMLLLGGGIAAAPQIAGTGDAGGARTR